jgi:GDP-L-fucose synthase
LLKNKKILVTGGTGMIGSALKKVLPDAVYISSKDYNLKYFEEANQMFTDHRPDYVIHLAARVGGVKANTDYIGEFFLDNTLININVLECARKFNTKKIVSLLSTCVYPDDVSYPLTEEQFHSGPPHISNFGYAYSKRMVDVQSRAYRKQYGCNFVTAIPNNLFGENDNYDLEDSHVIPAIMHKIYLAQKNKEDLQLWGDGSPLREFTYSGDLAKILVFLLEKYDDAEPINIGNTGEYSIAEIADLIAEHMGYTGEIIWDTTKPKGQFRKPSSNSKLLELGWKKQSYTNFEDAIKLSCDWFLENYPNLRGAK